MRDRHYSMMVGTGEIECAPGTTVVVRRLVVNGVDLSRWILGRIGRMYLVAVQEDAILIRGDEIGRWRTSGHAYHAEE